MTTKNPILHQTVIARDENAYIGCPFEGGFWSFDGGRDLLVAALRTPCRYDTRASVNPDRIRRGQAAWTTWRSRNGGRSWKADAPLFTVADAVRCTAAQETGPDAAPAPVSNPDVILAAFSIPFFQNESPGLFVSRDRGRSWTGPQVLSNVSIRLPNAYAQSSTCIRADGSMLFVLTTLYPDNRRRPCALLLDDLAGRRSLLSYLPRHRDMDRVFPSPATLPDGRIVVAVTEKMCDSPGHTLLFGSEDDGRTWSLLGRANDIGEPAHLLALRDGRLALTYGFPLPPYRLAARLSEDGGRSWSDEQILREGGGSPDLGSARSIQRDDGDIVTVYQWNDAGETGAFYGGRRYLAAAVWRP